MGNVVAMTYQPVQEIAKGHQESAQQVQTVRKVMDALYEVLIAANFMSPGTQAALRQKKATMDEKSDKLSKLHETFAANLQKAVSDHQKGVYEEGSYFGEGVGG